MAISDIVTLYLAKFRAFDGILLLSGPSGQGN